MLFQVTAIILLLVFYGCYFGKMFLQKRQGIQTEATGSHSRKMHFAEIPVLFYLIISGRHKPLLRTFTGTIQNQQNHKMNL